jgi:hypothetical protein
MGRTARAIDAGRVLDIDAAAAALNAGRSGAADTAEQCGENRA